MIVRGWLRRYWIFDGWMQARRALRAALCVWRDCTPQHLVRLHRVCICFVSDVLGAEAGDLERVDFVRWRIARIA